VERHSLCRGAGAIMRRETNGTLKMTRKIEVPMQAEAEGSGETDTEVVRTKLAEHGYVAADGTPVGDEESAHGISYKIIRDKATGEAVDLPAFVYLYGKNADLDRMLANFGAKTLATNESSAARQSKEGDSSAAGQMEAVKERFALLGTGKWVDRTREGVGAKIDKDALAGAIVAVAAAAGKTVDYAAVRQKLEEDPVFVRATRQVPAIATEYASRAGRPAKSLDDVLGDLGA
jgi:hypothetical protein